MVIIKTPLDGARRKHSSQPPSDSTSKNSLTQPKICQTERQVGHTRNDMAASGDKTATFTSLILVSYEVRNITYGHLPN